MLGGRNKLLKQYASSVSELKQSAREWGLSEEEINSTINESLVYMKEKYPDICQKHENRRRNWLKWCKLSYILVAVVSCCFGLYFYKPAHNFVERNIQGIIYPCMKFYRRITLPLVQHFPVLSELYDESCLIENPYFQVTDIDCWPCENARFVMNLTDSINNAHIGLPFVMKYKHTSTKWSDLTNAYVTYKDIVDSNAGRIRSNENWLTIGDVFNKGDDFFLDHPNAHIVWRINRMEVGRVLRNTLKPPFDGEVPPHATSVGIERFVLIDGPQSVHYIMPTTEGANVFLKQLSGQRLIVLEPAPECRDSCRRLSLLLEENHILWYNWWYWRPRSLPVQNATSPSIVFMGSTV